MKEKIIHRKDNPLLFLPTSFFFLCAQVHVWDYQVYMCTSACVELTVNCIYIFCFCFHLIVLHCFLSLIFLPRTTNSSLNLMKEVFLPLSLIPWGPYLLLQILCKERFYSKKILMLALKRIINLIL